MKYKLFLLVCGALFFFAGVNRVLAATLQLSANRTAFAIGDQFTVDVKVDSGGVGINAAQATIQVPKDVLQIVSADKGGSVFNFWITDPTISSDGSQASFVGGSTSGFSGKSLQIVHLVMKVKGSGSANISFTDGAVTANDGSGTNVLSSMKGLTISSGPSTGTAPISTEGGVTVEQQPQPTQITRPAIKVSGLPVKPQVQIPRYPNPQKWYNVMDSFSAQWDLPADITDVATAIDKNPGGIPQKSEGLFDNRRFSALDNGIWYLHVQFKNNVGWGPVAHYRIAIQTQPPSAFVARFDQGTSTDNPTPTVRFQTGDLAGIARYYVQVDNGEQKTVQPDTYTFPPLEPGEHIIRIGAEDNAGNITENRVVLQIIPIASPIITSVNKDVYIGEDNFQITGVTAASTTIRVLLKSKEGQVLVDSAAKPDDNGNWHAQFTQGVSSGDYYFEIRAVDGRGALSLPVKSDIFSVKVKPFLVVGRLQLSIGWFFGLIILFLLVGVGIVWVLRRLQMQQQARKVLMCQRDVSNLINMIKKDIDKILEKYTDEKIDETEVSEIQFLAKRIGVNIEKSGKYCIDSIAEINK